jgi:hypothetical protein
MPRVEIELAIPASKLIQASQDSSCLRTLGYRDQPVNIPPLGVLLHNTCTHTFEELQMLVKISYLMIILLPSFKITMKGLSQYTDQATDWTTRVRFLAGARDFSLLQNPDGSATYPASYGYAGGGLYPWR